MQTRFLKALLCSGALLSGWLLSLENPPVQEPAATVQRPQRPLTPRERTALDEILAACPKSMTAVVPAQDLLANNLRGLEARPERWMEAVPDLRMIPTLNELRRDPGLLQVTPPDSPLDLLGGLRKQARVRKLLARLGPDHPTSAALRDHLLYATPNRQEQAELLRQLRDPNCRAWSRAGATLLRVAPRLTERELQSWPAGGNDSLTELQQRWSLQLHPHNRGLWQLLVDRACRRGDTELHRLLCNVTPPAWQPELARRVFQLPVARLGSLWPRQESAVEVALQLVLAEAGKPHRSAAACNALDYLLSPRGLDESGLQARLLPWLCSSVREDFDRFAGLSQHPKPEVARRAEELLRHEPAHCVGLLSLVPAARRPALVPLLLQAAPGDSSLDMNLYVLGLLPLDVQLQRYRQASLTESGLPLFAFGDSDLAHAGPGAAPRLQKLLHELQPPAARERCWQALAGQGSAWLAPIALEQLAQGNIDRAGVNWLVNHPASRAELEAIAEKGGEGAAGVASALLRRDGRALESRAELAFFLATSQLMRRTDLDPQWVFEQQENASSDLFRAAQCFLEASGSPRARQLVRARGGRLLHISGDCISVCPAWETQLAGELLKPDGPSAIYALSNGERPGAAVRLLNGEARYQAPISDGQGTVSRTLTDAERRQLFSCRLDRPHSRDSEYDNSGYLQLNRGGGMRIRFSVDVNEQEPRHRAITRLFEQLAQAPGLQVDYPALRGVPGVKLLAHSTENRAARLSEREGHWLCAWSETMFRSTWRRDDGLLVPDPFPPDPASREPFRLALSSTDPPMPLAVVPERGEYLVRDRSSQLCWYRRGVGSHPPAPGEFVAPYLSGQPHSSELPQPGLQWAAAIDGQDTVYGLWSRRTARFLHPIRLRGIHFDTDTLWVGQRRTLLALEGSIFQVPTPRR